MKQVLVTTAIAACLGILAIAAFAADPVADGHVASVAEAQRLVSSGARPVQGVVDGYGTAPDVDRAAARGTGSNAAKCWYVLDVLLCD